MNLAPLLEPRSVAVVGASARPGSFGDQLVGQLLGGGYRGAVHLVNPRYLEVAGRPCLVVGTEKQVTAYYLRCRIAGAHPTARPPARVREAQRSGMIDGLELRSVHAR